jgi:hypothetical protein
VARPEGGAEGGDNHREPASKAGLLAASLVAATAVVLATVARLEAQSISKKFVGGPLTIEDHGSFFIGGVQKAAPYAVPAPPSEAVLAGGQCRTTGIPCQPRAEPR